MNRDQHPSFLELDRIHLGIGHSAAESHAENCAQCGAYLGRLALPVPVPATVVQQSHRPSSFLLRRPIAVLVGAAAACTLFAVGLQQVQPTANAPSESVRTKAVHPAVAVYIKRGDHVGLWDGQSPVQPGDLLRLEVASDGFRQIRVTAPSTSGAAQVLYQGEVGSPLLPVSFEVDGAGDAERLRVELSDPLQQAVPWSTQLVFPKHPLLPAHP